MEKRGKREKRHTSGRKDQPIRERMVDMVAVLVTRAEQRKKRQEASRASRTRYSEGGRFGS